MIEGVGEIGELLVEISLTSLNTDILSPGGGP